VDGLDLQFGLTTHDEAEARLNHRMVERVRRIVVLTDASKFGRVSLHRIALLDQIHTIITDAGIDDATARTAAAGHRGDHRRATA
jgi:DeoR family transcriptional regulator of aga operon